MPSIIYPLSVIVKTINAEADLPNLNDPEKKLFFTEKQIKAYPQFKNASEEEVVNIINSLHQLASSLTNSFQQS